MFFFFILLTFFFFLKVILSCLNNETRMRELNWQVINLRSLKRPTEISIVLLNNFIK